MISGWTLNTPTPIPFTVPASDGRDERQQDRDDRARAVGVCVAMMNAAMDAIVPMDRSMPPVSIASVWHAARMASGIAARIVAPTQSGLRTAGSDDREEHDQDDEQCRQRDERTIAQESTQSAARAATRPPVGRDAGLRRSCSGPPHRQQAAEHDDADEDRALDHGRQVRVRRPAGSGPSGRGPG